MAADYVSPGAAFGGGMESFLNLRAQQSHQNLLDSLAMKREERLAQAELDSMAEHRDELARKREKDQQDQHDKAVSDFEKETKDMVAGDRPSAEQLAKAAKLGKVSMFPQAAPPMSTAVGAPPAALQEAPPPNATAEGGLPTPEGALTPGAPTYRGSAAERLATDQRARSQAFVDALPDDNPHKEELKLALGAEAAGLKVPPGTFSKASVAKQRIIFDPVKRKYTMPDGTPVTDVPENAAIDRAAEPKDTSAGDATREATKQNHVDSVREHAYTELNKRAAPIEDQINNLNKLTTSLDANSPIADATLAEQIIKVTAGGANSGVRITQPEIQQVLSKSRTKWEDLQIALNKWTTAAPDEKNNPLFFTSEQKTAMRDLVKAYRAKANVLHKKIIDTRHQIDDAPDVGTINRVRTRAEEDIFAEPDTASATAAPSKKTAAQILKENGF